MRRTQEQWQAVIEEQQASGLPANAYCRANKICPKYFGKKRRELSAGLVDNAQTNTFIRMTVAPVVEEESLLELHYQGQCLKLPGSTSPNWLGQLMQTLHRGQ